MKKFTALFLALLIFITLFSCSSKEMSENSDGYMEPGGFPPHINFVPGKPDEEFLPGADDEERGFIENDFVSTSENKVSTFSADVDTASYTLLRKMVKNGFFTKIDASMLRTEEMINYFDYSYEGPREGELFGINPYFTRCPWNGENMLLTVGLRASDAVPFENNNLVFLIDVSGSMRASDKLPLLKKAFSYLLPELDEHDTVSIVTYSGKEETVLSGCEGNRSDKIMKAINSLEADGMTNGQAGLEKAYSVASDYFIKNGNNRIIMASDGDLNVGISSAGELEKFISEKRESGIYLSVLGFGDGNYRDASMEAIADNGNGVYYYIDGETEAEKIFGRDLLGTLYSVASDVKMQLTFDPLYIDSYRLIGYENRILNKEDFDDDTKDAGEVGAGHRVTVCYEIKLTEEARKALDSGTAKDDETWFRLAVRYKRPGEYESVLNEYKWNSGIYCEPDSDISFIGAVIETSMILHDSKYANGTDYAAVIKTLEDLDLSADKYKTEFYEIVCELAKHG